LEVPPTVYGDENLVPPRLVIVQGCLTASGDRFVLTALEPGVRGPIAARRYGKRLWAKDKPTTEAYRLVGADDSLRPLVAQRVAIIGESEPEQVVDVRESSPGVERQIPFDPQTPQPVGTSGLEPRVSMIQTTRIEIYDLKVRSVRAIGERCFVSS
jgi:hypothetical protein